ncbi:hypothetical protein RV00_GL001517 [Enterococcus devriesei]|uniref:Uncharacterized protein n=2 Tax=Enterococcus devriesei TaxID=319970 RepID=A0A1L8SMH2_9ENTE|nr:hypothetical protein RV00_GL001517 [Enterococcus devriesei]
MMLFLYLLLLFFLGLGGVGLPFLMIISGHCLVEFVGE